MKRIIAFLAAMLLCSSIAYADALSDLRSFMNDTRTVSANFEQVTHSKTGKLSQPVTGTLMLSRPGKFRWQTKMPYPQLIVGDGERVWFYDEDLSQVVVRSREEALGGTPAALLAGDADLDKTFQISPLPDRDGMSWLAAVPYNKEAGFKEIRLGFVDGKLKMLELDDAFQQKIVTRFIEVRYNPEISPDQFVFTPPPGADVIGQQQPKKD
jgi:periplasmic chaperone LolA